MMEALSHAITKSNSYSPNWSALRCACRAHFCVVFNTLVSEPSLTYSLGRFDSFLSLIMAWGLDLVVWCIWYVLIGVLADI